MLEWAAFWKGSQASEPDSVFHGNSTLPQKLEPPAIHYELKGSPFQRSEVIRVRDPGLKDAHGSPSQGALLYLSEFPWRWFASDVQQGRESQLIRNASDLRLTGIFRIHKKPKARKSTSLGLRKVRAHKHRAQARSLNTTHR